jgi:transposase
MARYKDVHYDQDKFIPVSFQKQILPGTFEYTLSYLIDHELDLSIFDSRYQNDETGAPAFDPAVLLKIVIYAYSRGITSSRKIEQACRENIIFMALSADTQPHFTTLADFISQMDEQILPLFRNVLLICDELKLIGGDMFAIDGCKLPSNASKAWSGTKWELKQKRKKMEQAARAILKRHRDTDAKPADAGQTARERQAAQAIRDKARKIKAWLDDHDDKPGKGGTPIKSNITDNESAKIKTSKGVIQGYDGVACVDAKHQIVVDAQAFGAAQEHDLLTPLISETQESFHIIGNQTIFKTAKLTADSGFYNTANVTHLYQQGIDGYLPDLGFRKRDPRFAQVERHRARAKQDRQAYYGKTRQHYTSPDFHYDAKTHTCICPAGKPLYSNGRALNLNGYETLRFRGTKQTCLPCDQRYKCMKDPSKTQTRQVAIFIGRTKQAPPSYLDLMKRKIDTPEGRYQYSRRMGIVEPVFAHICSALGLNRFSLRSKKKVDIQWKLYCMVHNLLKIHRYGELAI